MGKRTIFQVLDGDKSLIATLFANSLHTTQFAETVFEHTIKDSDTHGGPSALVEKLLSMRYEADEGNHAKGDRIFSLVAADEFEQGDWEEVFRATHCSNEELLSKGYTHLEGAAWNCERQQFSDL